MLFTVTSSNCKVKIARFFRILMYTRWKITKQKIFVQVSIAVACFISKIQQFERVFTVRDTKRGMLSRCKKVYPLDFQQYDLFKY